MSDEIEVYWISEVRVMGVRADPSKVVLRISAEGEELHFGMTVKGLERLGQRFVTDAKLLS